MPEVYLELLARDQQDILLEDVVRHKKIFFNAPYANYDDCLSGNLKLLPGGRAMSGLQTDYENMVRAGMMYRDPPEFPEIIEAIQRIETEINNW